MFLFETILFYNRIPCFYKVYRKEEKFYCEADPNPYYKSINFPNFYMADLNMEWVTEGTTDASLINQMKEEIEKHSLVHH